MMASKRKNLGTQLQRRVRARRDSSEESEGHFNDSASENVNAKEASRPSDQDAEDTSEGSEEDIEVKLPTAYFLYLILIHYHRTMKPTPAHNPSQNWLHPYHSAP